MDKDNSNSKKQNKKTPVYVSQNFEVAFVKSGYYVDAANSQIKLADIEYDKIINQNASYIKI